MDVTTLKQQITSKTPAMVYLALGTQQVLIQRVREMFINLIPEEERVMNVGSYDMETTPLAVALDDAMAAPFFGERRLVLINKPYLFTRIQIMEVPGDNNEWQRLCDETSSISASSGGQRDVAVGGILRWRVFVRLYQKSGARGCTFCCGSQRQVCAQQRRGLGDRRLVEATFGSERSAPQGHGDGRKN